jgi:hypothetical protein
MYLAHDDLDRLAKHLFNESELAFIVPSGPRRWRAVHEAMQLHDGRHCLWHVASGPLPLVRQDPQEPGLVTDPSSGWTEERSGADPTQPYFGAGHPGIFWLNIRGEVSDSGIGLSSFEWIGRRYAGLGSEPSEATERLWNRLKGWVRRNACQVPRGGPLQVSKPEVWAFPSAHALLEGGLAAALNP